MVPVPPPPRAPTGGGERRRRPKFGGSGGSDKTNNKESRKENHKPRPTIHQEQVRPRSSEATPSRRGRPEHDKYGQEKYDNRGYEMHAKKAQTPLPGKSAHKVRRVKTDRDYNANGQRQQTRQHRGHGGGNGQPRGHHYKGGGMAPPKAAQRSKSGMPRSKNYPAFPYGANGGYVLTWTSGMIERMNA